MQMQQCKGRDRLALLWVIRCADGTGNQEAAAADKQNAAQQGTTNDTRGISQTLFDVPIKGRRGEPFALQCKERRKKGVFNHTALKRGPPATTLPADRPRDAPRTRRTPRADTHRQHGPDRKRARTSIAPAEFTCPAAHSSAAPDSRAPDARRRATGRARPRAPPSTSIKP